MIAGKKVSRTVSIEAPTGGLNARDPVANMKPNQAVVMENWFPRKSDITVRNGYKTHVSGFSAPVRTLAFYNNGTDQKLFACSGDGIYDATTEGAVGAAEVTGLTSSKFQTINLGTAGGFFLLMVNGEDKMQIYDGSVWDADGGGTYTVTGVDTANCIHINNFKNRVWLIEKDSFRAWYLPVSSIAGAAASLNLGGLFKLGGYLMAMANWTIDNAAGIDDYAAFITSEGEVALYKGTDPSSATTWSMVGTFRMGKPIGRRCFCKAGADVLVLTEDGAFPLSKALLTDRSQLSLAATDDIVNLINADIKIYSQTFGWQPIIYPNGQKLIINVPTTTDKVAKQYVMNTGTGAWTKFTGWNAICFELLNDGLFFGGENGVYQADIGNNDNGAEINSIVQQAFSYFGNNGAVKKFNMARCILSSNGDIKPAIKLNVDYDTISIGSAVPFYTETGGFDWDDSYWDEEFWGGGERIIKRWQTITGIGYAGSLRINISTKDVTCSWISTDFVFEVGGTL